MRGLTPASAFGRRAPRALLALFAAVHLLLALTGTPGGATAATWLALLLVIASAATLVLAPDRALSGRAVAGILVALTAANVLALSVLPAGPRLPGFGAWQLGAIAFTLLALALRGRVGAAWAGMALLLAVVIAWAVLTGRGAGFGLETAVRQTGTLVLGTVFAVGLGVVTRALDRADAAGTAAEVRAHAAAEGDTARREEVASVLAQVAPALRRIAEGRPLDAAARHELDVLEGALRDRIRAAGLVREPLLSAAAAARRRGVDVTLLDDDTVGTASEEQRAAIRRWLAARLDATRSGRFVGRVRVDPAAPGARASAVTDDGRAVFGGREG